MITRRRFLKNSGLAASSLLIPGIARAANSWSAGNVNHLIPLVSSDSILIKSSFRFPQQSPTLRVGSRSFAGKQMDSPGRFWSFFASGLESNQQYELTLEDQNGTRLADPWPLATAPGDDDTPEQLRVLVYTCAGGPDPDVQPSHEGVWLPIAIRRRLLARARSFSPDLAMGLGDQIYWDQSIRPDRNTPEAREGKRTTYQRYGVFDETQPVYGTDNETTLINCLEEQIGGLYGTDFRSIPTILSQDDHDHFENDEAHDTLITFPPKNFNLQLARASQSLMFPEYLPDNNRPTHLASSDRNGISESYGSFRWGSLLEMLIYDCRRHMSLKGLKGAFVEEGAEDWLHRRTKAEQDARHLIHLPSIPMGWTAGKWGEWYPDLLNDNSQLSKATAKPYWQPGWFEQHNRILSTISEQRERIPLMISGDLHAVASGAIVRSGDLSLSNPVNSILSGPISSDTRIMTSSVRGTPPLVPVDLVVNERTKPLENAGFTILDIDTDGISVRQFAWHSGMGVDSIDTLNPISSFRLE